MPDIKPFFFFLFNSLHPQFVQFEYLVEFCYAKLCFLFAQEVRWSIIKTEQIYCILT